MCLDDTATGWAGPPDWVPEGIVLFYLLFFLLWQNIRNKF